MYTVFSTNRSLLKKTITGPSLHFVGYTSFGIFQHHWPSLEGFFVISSINNKANRQNSSSRLNTSYDTERADVIVDFTTLGNPDDCHCRLNHRLSVAISFKV
jgi:hypothetical protein